MRILTNHRYIMLGVAFFFGYLIAKQPTVIQGKVVWEKTAAPAENVFVYITEGEEEDLTDKNGNFSIRTWKKLPTELLIKYKGNPVYRVPVKDGNKKHTIYLKQP